MGRALPRHASTLQDFWRVRGSNDSGHSTSRYHGWLASRGETSALRLAPSHCSSTLRSLPRARGLFEAGELRRVLTIGHFESHVQDHLWELTKEIGPRLTSSSNLERAYEWARARFASYGLDARIEPYVDWAVGFDRGPASGGMVSPETRAYTFNTQAWSPGTTGPLRGRAILHPATMEEFEAVRSRLAGAWLVQRVRARGEEDLPKEVRDAVREASQKEGIAGTIRRDRRAYRSPSAILPGMDSLPTGVSVTLLASDYDDLVARLGRAEPVELEFDVQNHFREGPIRLCNVVADLRGSEHPDEFVIVQAHLDSWDGAEGAQDNGTGVATTLEAARILAAAGVQPHRTIRFVLYSGEEQGLFGSSAYVEAHKDELARTSMVSPDEANYLRGITAALGSRRISERVFTPEGPRSEAPFENPRVDGFGPPAITRHSSSPESPRSTRDQDGRATSSITRRTTPTSSRTPRTQRHWRSRRRHLRGVRGSRPLIDRRPMSPPRQSQARPGSSGTKLAGVIDGGRASAAGWKEGDVIVAIDGEEPKGQAGVVRLVQQGEPRKTIRVQRGAEFLDTVLDWSDDPDEPRRAEYRARREAAKAAAAAKVEAEKKK
jgi:hypothetical protein